MKACFFRAFGGPEVLQYGELPDPVSAAGEVLVDVHAASVNAADWKMRAGQYSAGIDFPHVPGRDFSGVVAAFGKGATDFKVGDAVFGVCEVPREGAYAERITIRQEILAGKRARRHHRERGEPRLCARARRGRSDRLPRAGLHPGRQGLHCLTCSSRHDQNSFRIRASTDHSPPPRITK